MKRILVLRGGALGDFILTLPALRLLHARWPEARLELVGNARAAELGRCEGILAAVHSQHEARWAALCAPDPLPLPLRDWLASFDLILCAWPDADGQIARHLQALGPRCLFGAAQPQLAPAARHFCALLAPLGLATDDFRSRLTFARGGLPAPHSGPVALHPGSGSPRRNWPLAHWIDLCERLRAQVPLLLVGGEAEAAACRTLAKYGDTAFDLPLPDLARRLAACRAYVGHDTGVTHLAAAVGTPCLALFGPSDPALWAPPGPHVRVLRAGADLATLGVVEVFAEFERLLASELDPSVQR